MNVGLGGVPSGLFPSGMLRSFQIISPGPRHVRLFSNKASFFYSEEYYHFAQHPSWRNTPWRQFLHPQPEDAPCRGDRNPLIVEYEGKHGEMSLIFQDLDL